MTDAIVTQANATYRDYIVDGVPSSLPHNPSKSDIRSLWLTLGGILDGLSGGGSGGSYVGFTTLALLNANLAYPANTVGEVIADSTPSNNGIYLKSGASGSGSWTLVSGFTLSGLNAAIAAETTRAEAAESLLAPQASPALTGTPTAPTAALGTNTTQIATTAFAGAAAGAAALAYAYVLSPSIGYFQGFPVEEAVISSNGQILSITTTAGTFFSDGNGQFVGNTVDATGIASSVGFFAGDSVISASVDQQGELLEVKTRTSDFRRGPSGLAPVGPRATQHDAPALAPTSINATACVVGVSYTILTVGTTNFTLIGAPANTVGLVFVATGAGTGTGTVTSNRYIGVGVQNDPVTNIILFLGQSNAAGNGDSADPNCAITTGALTSIFPNFALMPSTGVRLPVLGSTGNAPAPLTPIFTSLANLVESADSGNQLFETAASGCVNQLISALSTASGGVATTVAAMVAAHGSWSLAQLSRGTPVYNWMLQGLRDMCSAIFASGRRPVVIWADYNQPETDASNNTDSALYAAGLVRMCRNINNDCKAITGQTEDIVMSLTASQYGESSVGYNNILLAQEKAASVEPRIKLGNSTYYLPRVSRGTI